jgi:hypothetical protein
MHYEHAFRMTRTPRFMESEVYFKIVESWDICDKDKTVRPAINYHSELLFHGVPGQKRPLPALQRWPLTETRTNCMTTELKSVSICDAYASQTM